MTCQVKHLATGAGRAGVMDVPAPPPGAARIHGRSGLALACALVAIVLHPAAAPCAPSRLEAALDALVAAYPRFLSGHDGNVLIWKDGTRMIIDDGRSKTHQQKLREADIEDMLSQPYPLGPCSFAPPPRNFDPGRIRNEAFFRKIYGGTKRQVQARLATVRWFGQRLRVTTVNGVNRKLAAVAAELARLPARYRKYFIPSAGTFNWRVIAGTKRLSVHAFGAAIDINARYADYWRWAGGRPGNVPRHRNRIPRRIVEIFERHGFIWGGKWYHYDTMHFEYRPELLATARRCRR